MIAPPMSGENLPFKELKPEGNIKAGEKEIAKKAKKKLYLIFFLLLVIFFVGGIFLGLFLKQKDNQAETISPSPSPAQEAEIAVSPSPSPAPTGLKGKIDALGEKLEKVDLKEEKVIPPKLDFNIRFDVED